MPRYALKIEYQGAPYSGWQRQPDRPSVQGSIETALRKLDSDVETVAAAGRTDAGVHAMAQVAHVDLKRDWDPFRLSEALNFHLKPQPIGILAVAQVSDDWHARFSAQERRYLYRLVSLRAPLTYDEPTIWRVTYDLDGDLMREGAKHLIGHHDFTTFRSTICQAKTPLKTMDKIDIEVIPYSGGTEFRFHVTARSFLHNQVRSLVGSLERVGAGNWPPERIKEALKAKDRSACGPVAPPHGLYLAHVAYKTAPFAGIKE